MSRRGILFFLTIVAVLILTQVMVLVWGLEAIFFVTWFVLGLTVRHDSRLSPAIGLLLLASCPFLLIAEKESQAELAANYAYFFLAMGVLIQLEEMVLERYGWLQLKLDLSPIWEPAVQVLRERWRMAERSFVQLAAAADRTELVRLVQIVGAAGLAVVFLWAALSGASVATILPLLGAALLFPFVVWGLRSLLRFYGWAWLLRIVVALIVVSLVALEMVWLFNVVTADRLARMDTVYDFIEQSEEALRTEPILEGEVFESRAWIIEEQAKRVLFQHPAFSGVSRVAFPLAIERGAALTFELATSPNSWDQAGDGVSFAIYVESDGFAEQVFSTYIDPKHDPADRRWHPYTVDLGDYAGQTVTIIFETGVGPAGDYRFDWAGWGEPRLLAP